MIAVGRQKGDPEATLVADYLSRFDAAGRGIGLGPASVIEVEDKKRRGAGAEGDLLLGAAADGAYLVALDERGKTMDSRAFAALIADQRDQGRRDMAFLIGGADGHSEDVLAAADKTLAFGVQTWPHMLVRAMLAEQLYRAEMILARHPYHHA